MDITDKTIHADSYMLKGFTNKDKELLPFTTPRKFSNWIVDGDFYDSNNIQSHVSIITLLENIPAKGNDILYLACGFGLGIKLLEMKGFNVEGIDIQTDYVKFCRERKLKVSKGNAITLEGIEKQYDVIISRDFLRRDYHNERYLQVLNESLNNQYEHLKDTGMAIIYSTLFDTKGCDIASSQRLNNNELFNQKFSKLERYKIKYSKPEIIQYAEVFLK